MESLVFKLTAPCAMPQPNKLEPHGHIRAIIKLFWFQMLPDVIFHSFSGQIHGIFPSPDFFSLHVCVSISPLSLASACSTIALLFVSRLFARKTRRKFVQISSQKYREKRLPTNIKPSTGELCKWLTVLESSWKHMGFRQLRPVSRSLSETRSQDNSIEIVRDVQTGFKHL